MSKTKLKNYNKNILQNNKICNLKIQTNINLVKIS